MEGPKKRNKNGQLQSTTDLTIIPIEFKMVIYVAFRDGINTKHGSTPEISYRRIGMGNQSVEGELIIKDCHYIQNPELNE